VPPFERAGEDGALRKTEMRLTSIMRLHISWVISANGDSLKVLALFTRMPI
jgi:hypothetical protein